jgi:hypothetical protein
MSQKKKIRKSGGRQKGQKYWIYKSLPRESELIGCYVLYQDGKRVADGGARKPEDDKQYQRKLNKFNSWEKFSLKWLDAQDAGLSLQFVHRSFWWVNAFELEQRRVEVNQILEDAYEDYIKQGNLLEDPPSKIVLKPLPYKTKKASRSTAKSTTERLTDVYSKRIVRNAKRAAKRKARTDRKATKTMEVDRSSLV